MSEATQDLNQVITSAVQARIETEVLAALSGSDVFARFVQAALHRRITIRDRGSYRGLGETIDETRRRGEPGVALSRPRLVAFIYLMVFLAAIAHLATSGAFADAGIWAAIVAGSIALVAGVGSIARWAWAHGAAPRRDDVHGLDEAHADHRTYRVAGSAGPAYVFESLDQPRDFGRVEDCFKLDDRCSRWYLRNVHGGPISVVQRPGSVNCAGLAFFRICRTNPTLSIGRKDPANYGEKRQLSWVFPAILQAPPARFERATARLAGGSSDQTEVRGRVCGGRGELGKGSPGRFYGEARVGLRHCCSFAIDVSAPWAQSRASTSRLLLLLARRTHVTGKPSRYQRGVRAFLLCVVSRKDACSTLNRWSIRGKPLPSVGYRPPTPTPNRPLLQGIASFANASYRDRETTFIAETVEKAIQEATAAAVRKVVAEEAPAIEAEVTKELRRNVKALAAQLVGSVGKAAESPYGVKVELNYPNRD